MSNLPVKARAVIIGGGKRGVVAAARYISRTYGVRSAMPMFKALALCPQAAVIPPDMAKYVATARHVRRLMEALSPLVQPLSIDEAVLDLSGTEALHGAPPAVVLNRFARRVEAEIGITVSIGLARNRLLAKLAAERGKPRGFSVLGREAASILAPEPVGLLPGIGPVTAARLLHGGLRLEDLPASGRLTGRTGQRVLDNMATAIRCRDLARMRTDVPVAHVPDGRPSPLLPPAPADVVTLLDLW